MKNTILSILLILSCVTESKSQQKDKYSFTTHYGGYVDYANDKTGKKEVLMEWVFDFKLMKVFCVCLDRNINEIYPVYSINKQINISGTASKEIYNFKCAGGLEFHLHILSNGQYKIDQIQEKDTGITEEGIKYTKKFNIFTTYPFDDTLKEYTKG